ACTDPSSRAIRPAGKTAFPAGRSLAMGVCFGLDVGGQDLDVYPERAFGIGADNGQSERPVDEVLAPLGDMTQFGSQPAAYGVVVALWQCNVKLSVEIFYGGNAHGPPTVVARLEDGLGFVFVELVLDIAHNLFQHVFHGDQAGRATMFVDHDGEMVAAAAEVVQQDI